MFFSRTFHLTHRIQISRRFLIHIDWHTPKVKTPKTTKERQYEFSNSKFFQFFRNSTYQCCDSNQCCPNRGNKLPLFLRISLFITNKTKKKALSYLVPKLRKRYMKRQKHVFGKLRFSKPSLMTRPLVKTSALTRQNHVSPSFLLCFMLISFTSLNSVDPISNHDLCCCCWIRSQWSH